MEMQAIAFQNATLRVIKSTKPVIGIVHWRMRHPVIDAITERSDIMFLDVTIQNRETLHFKVLEELSKILLHKGFSHT